MTDFPKDPSVLIELLNRTAEETAVQVAETADWTGLIALAKAGDPAPLREVLRQIGTTRTNLYPPEMQEFQSLMEKHKPKNGRPRKDGNEALRAAGKAWEVSYLKDTLKIVADAYRAAKKLDKQRNRHISIEALPYQISVVMKSRPGKKVARLQGTGTASELALNTMADALFGTSDEALRNKIYPRKKGTTKKPK